MTRFRWIAGQGWPPWPTSWPADKVTPFRRPDANGAALHRSHDTVVVAGARRHLGWGLTPQTGDLVSAVQEVRDLLPRTILPARAAWVCPDPAGSQVNRCRTRSPRYRPLGHRGLHRRDPTGVGDASGQRLLDWMYVCHQDKRPVAVEDVRGEPWSFFKGDPLTDAELQKTAHYLYERGLIDGATVDQRYDPLRPTIEPGGRVCVEKFDGSVVAWKQCALWLRAPTSSWNRSRAERRQSDRAGAGGVEPE